MYIESDKQHLSIKEEDKLDDIRNLKQLFMDKAVQLNQAGEPERAKHLQEASKKLASGEAFKSSP